jgi:hypothetical protein
MGTRTPAHTCIRHWYRGHEIHQKYGDIQIRMLRLVYGAGFAPAFYASHTLREVLPLLDRSSLDKLLADYPGGELEAKLSSVLV